jgi:arylsulfatase
MTRLLQLILITAVVALLSVSAPAGERPNILIILADDLGWSDLGCYGGEIRTPNLDRLGQDGIRFTQCYNGARCCPSRASLLTGLYPHQAGVGAMTTSRPGQGDGYRGSLNDRCVTIGEVLAAAGYRTALSGKWHVSNQEPPTARGFQDFFGFSSGYAVDSWEPGMMIRLPQGRPERHYEPGLYFATDAITDYAVDFITDMHASGAPWMLYLAYQAPHFPVQSRIDDMAGYPALYAQGWDRIRDQRLERQLQLGLLPAGTPLSPRSPIPNKAAAKRDGSLTEDGQNPAWEALAVDRRADLAQRMSVYAGMVTGLDRNVGRLIASLRARGQLDNTLILFLSDNGACAEWDPYGFDLPPGGQPRAGCGIDFGTERMISVCHTGADLERMGGPGSRVSYGSGWANACNAPFRMYKHYVHEGGIATPLIVHWPLGIGSSSTPGRLVTQPTHLIDLMATVVDIGSAPYPTEFHGHRIEPMEGLSLRPFIVGTSAPAAGASRELCWEHEGNAAIRVGDRKLVRISRKGPWELYDLSTDRSELHDLASAHPEEARALAARWEAWAERVHVYIHPRASDGTPAGRDAEKPAPADTSAD